MKFSEMPYARPDFDAYKSEFTKTVDAFRNAPSYNEQLQSFRRIYEMRSVFETMMGIASTRNSINTADTFYEAEQNFFDENEPHYRSLVMQFYRALIAARFRADLEKEFGVLL